MNDLISMSLIYILNNIGGSMIKDFDLSDWICFSERRNSKSYYSKDKKWMVKLGTDLTMKNEDELLVEKEITDKALRIGIKTPKVGDVIMLSDEKTTGLIYEYIENKKSISRAASEDIENYDYYIQRFARSAKDFHSKICDPKEFDSQLERIKKQINLRGFFSGNRREKVLNFLDSINDTYNCIHGDFQTSNFIMTDKDEFAIDLGAIAYGNPIFDVGCLYYFWNVLPQPITEPIFHCEHKWLRPMWESFCKYYYGMETKEEIEEFDKKMLKESPIYFCGMFEFIDPGKEMPVLVKLADDLFDKYFGE